MVGCNSEPDTVVLDSSETEESGTELSPESNFLSELENEIIASITEKTELDRESIAIMLGGSFKEMSVSVSYPKDVKVDETVIQQVVEDSIKKFSEAENVTISEEDIIIKIEKY